MMIIGIDVGGTKIAAAAFDMDWIPLKESRYETPQSYDDFIEIISFIAKDLKNNCSTTAPRSIGIGLPGRIGKDGHVTIANNLPWLNNRDICSDLNKLTGLQTRIANDVSCFLLSENRGGVAEKYDVVFSIILGTGVGSSLSVAGRIISGVNNLAGEWGQNSTYFRSSKSSGTIEEFLSGNGLSNDYYYLTNSRINADIIHDLYKSGDKIAEKALNIYFNRLAEALSSIINIIDPDMIVVGGGMSNITDIFLEVPRILEKYCVGFPAKTQLVRPHFGPGGGLRGAALLWDPKKTQDTLFYQSRKGPVE